MVYRRKRGDTKIENIDEIPDQVKEKYRSGFSSRYYPGKRTGDITSPTQEKISR